MRRTLVFAGFLSALVSMAMAQGGQAGGFGGAPGGGGGFGGGGFGGGQAGRGGMQQETYDSSVQGIENSIRRYLDGNEVKNILTPGEFSEWPLTLKEGEVVIAEARSDAFDPALEIVDKDAKVLASNDDRYPGDQRPLLIWRCTTAGSYSIRGRCFHDKAGGQFFLRMRTYESMDLAGDKPVDREFDQPTTFLLRIPMKAGEIKQVYSDVPDWEKFSPVSLDMTISPIGLPDVNLAKSLRAVIPNTILAPVDGDYYTMAYYSNSAKMKVRAGARTISPLSLPLEAESTTATATANTGVATLWTLSVKKGQVLKAATPDLSFGSQMIVVEQPDVSKFDLKKPETNPFFPATKKEGEDADQAAPALTILPGRSRDSRVSVFVARKDARLWIAAVGYAPQQKQYTLKVSPAAKDFDDKKSMGSKLRIGDTDYWAFDAKVGDVMTFKFGAAGFSERLVIRDPDLTEIWNGEAAPDQFAMDSSLIARIPGRYLVAMSSYGDGGGGDYTLERHVFHAKEFKKGTDASGSFADGSTQVWKFTATPEEPLLIHWKSSEWTYSVTVRDSIGNEARLPLEWIDGKNQYGILKVAKPTEYMIVLIPGNSKAQYSISLNDLPGMERK